MPARYAAPSAARPRRRRPCAPPRCASNSSSRAENDTQPGPSSRRAALLAAALLMGGMAQCPVRADDSDGLPLPDEGLDAQLPALESAPVPPSAPVSTLESKSLIDGQGETRLLPVSATADLTQAQKQVLEYNLRSQRQNAAPPDFPSFVRQGYDMTILADGYQISPEGLIYRDFVEGVGEQPGDGQEVVFDYTAYNESAAIIVRKCDLPVAFQRLAERAVPGPLRADSSYRKGEAARTRLGIQGLIPGFELGVRSMRPGGKRRIVVPPELGPPVGPSTFFSAKQFEVFDIELRAVKTCSMRTMGMFKQTVCE
eukprot:scaffold18.g1958.t1